MSRIVPAKPGMRMRRMNATRAAKIVALLMRQAYTVAELAEAVDLAIPQTRDYVTALRAHRPKILHVAEWRSIRYGIRPLYVAAYMLGSLPDARRPAKKSSRERCAAYRERQKAKALQAIIGGIQA